MARYSKQHKARSRAAIVAGAARLFRKCGYSGVGIDQLCAEAGLTRGSFYAHFKSKADLLAAVLSGGHDLVRRLAARRQTQPRALAQAGVKVARDYLHVKNRPGVLGGCSLASLAMDTVRGDAQAQAAYADAVAQVVAEFQRPGGAVSAEQARAALALCVGGLLVGAACGDNPIGDQVAQAARAHVQTLLGGE